nr:unnamed protein product [Meloidogyne enterolobii]
MKISPPTNLEIKKTIKPEIKKKNFELDLEETDFEFPLNLFEDMNELKLVEELKNSVPTNFPKKTIKKSIKETNFVEKFEKETDFDLPMDLFEAKEDKFEHESPVSGKGLAMDFEEDDFELPINLFEEKDEVKFKESEKEHVEAETIEEILFENMVQIAKEDEPVEKDFEELRQEKASDLGRMKIDLDFCNLENSLEIKERNFEKCERNLDPVIEENFKEPRKEKANELGRMKFDHGFFDQNVLKIESEDLENFSKETGPLKEYIGKENFTESEDLIAYSDFKFIKVLKFSKTRKSFTVKVMKNCVKSFKKNGNFKRMFKSNVKKQFEEYSFSEKYSVLKRINSKMKLLKVSVLKKINAKMKRKAMKQEKFGWRKRKIKGRFSMEFGGVFA